jgi:hypothetical protein
MVTAQEEYAAFLANQESANYNFAGMTTEQQDAEMREYTRLKLAAAKEKKMIADFYAARDVALAVVQAANNVTYTAALTLWQAKENNGYDVNYQP